MRKKHDFPQFFAYPTPRHPIKRASDAFPGRWSLNSGALGGLVKRKLTCRGRLRSGFVWRGTVESQLFAQAGVQLLAGFRMRNQIGAGVLAALADPLSTQAEPGAA